MLLKHKQKLFEKVLPSTMLIKGFVKRSQDWIFCQHLCCNIFSTKPGGELCHPSFRFGEATASHAPPLPLLCCIWVCVQLLYSWVVYWSIIKRTYSQLVYPCHNPCRTCMLHEQNLKSLYVRISQAGVIKQTSNFL